MYQIQLDRHKRSLCKGVPVRSNGSLDKEQLLGQLRSSASFPGALGWRRCMTVIPLQLLVMASAAGDPAREAHHMAEDCLQGPRLVPELRGGCQDRQLCSQWLGHCQLLDWVFETRKDEPDSILYPEKVSDANQQRGPPPVGKTGSCCPQTFLHHINRFN